MKVKVTLDGVTTKVPAGITVPATARLMNIDIPALCDHRVLKPIGACQMFLVETVKRRATKLIVVDPRKIPLTNLAVMHCAGIRH